jgi:hypothetical protein
MELGVGGSLAELVAMVGFVDFPVAVGGVEKWKACFAFPLGIFDLPRFWRW